MIPDTNNDKPAFKPRVDPHYVVPKGLFNADGTDKKLIGCGLLFILVWALIALAITVYFKPYGN